MPMPSALMTKTVHHLTNCDKLATEDTNISLFMCCNWNGNHSPIN